MKVVAFNINGLKSSLPYLNRYLMSEDRPDVLGLNEIKCTPKTLETLKNNLNQEVLKLYNVIWNPAQKIAYHGTALFILKSLEYRVISTELPNSSDDEETAKGHLEEGRVIAAEIEGICFILTYVPNSGVNRLCPLRRLEYRVSSWDRDMFWFVEKMWEMYNGKVIWFGDLNVARERIDIKRPRRQAGYTEEERASFASFMASGRFVDLWRKLNPEKPGYTYKTGWRLDYFIIGSKLFESVKEGIMCSVEDDPEEVSDHWPISCEF